MSATGPTGGDVAPAFLAEARRQLAACRDRIAHCLNQLDDGQVWWRPREPLNSIGNLLLHVCGNVRQWVVSAVGGAADVRDRPQEFAERGPISRDELLRRFDALVAEADAVLAQTAPDQLLAPRRVQGFHETVLSAIFSCLTHLSGHTQEIIYATRLQLGDAYRFHWTPTTKEPSGRKILAARDAVFRQGLVGDVPASDEGPTDAAGPARSPLRDHTRELQQEFQEQEDEGKL